MGNLPNLLSFARLLAVPVAVWLMLGGRFSAAFWLFAAAGATDALDGFLAKRFGWQSELGSYLDPLADKALLVSVFLVLGWTGHIPAWLAIMVVFRDLLIVGGALVVVAITGTFRADPMFVSKLNTTLQIFLASAVLAELGLGLDISAWRWVLVDATALTTFASGLAYVVRWTRRLGQEQDAA
ncbi:MAG: CDP-alcohol phosphatidyltransferase family protein [Rhodospirillales bacterium]|nr:CDP-alcohol phosphatidyltransferase family protein [Rhodospirillales bacterium]